MAGAFPATLEVLKASHMARIEVASRARTDWPVQSLNPDFKDLNIFHARGKGSDATRVATRLVPGSLQYARDLTVTALLGKPPNLALTLPLPSTSSENLGGWVGVSGAPWSLRRRSSGRRKGAGLFLSIREWCPPWCQRLSVPSLGEVMM